MTVVAVESPRLNHAIGVPVFAGPTHVIHDLAAPVFRDGRAHTRADRVEHFIPGDALPFALTAFTDTLERVQNAVGIFKLIRRDHALGARAAPAAWMHRVALDLADVERVLVDVGKDAAR